MSTGSIMGVTRRPSTPLAGPSCSLARLSNALRRVGDVDCNGQSQATGTPSSLKEAVNMAAPSSQTGGDRIWVGQSAQIIRNRFRVAF